MPDPFSYTSCEGAEETPPSTATSYRRARDYDTEALANVYLPNDSVPSMTGGQRFHFFNPDDEECYYVHNQDSLVADPPDNQIIDGWEDLGIDDDGSAFWLRLCDTENDPCSPGAGSGSYAFTDLDSLTADAMYKSAVIEADTVWSKSFTGTHPTWTNPDGADRPLYKTADPDNPGDYLESVFIDDDLTQLVYDAGECLWLIEIYLPDGTLLAGYAKDTGESAVGVYSRDLYDTTYTGAGVGTGSDWAMIA